MPDPADIWPENAAGRFFVDRSCIDCDLCRTTAPHNFRRSELGYSFLAVQPRGEQEERDCQKARQECPVEAIGERTAASGDGGSAAAQQGDLDAPR